MKPTGLGKNSENTVNGNPARVDSTGKTSQNDGPSKTYMAYKIDQLNKLILSKKIANTVW